VLDAEAVLDAVAAEPVAVALPALVVTPEPAALEGALDMELMTGPPVAKAAQGLLRVP
jgi:hypothetical protein